MKNWIEQVDFAWVGKDSNGSVGICYVPSDFVPNEQLPDTFYIK